MTDTKRICLALGSGGARGYTHIGVIDELTARGHEVVAIAGTSMGAVVGGVHAAGHLDEFTAWVTTLTQTGVLRLLDPGFGQGGVVKGDRLFDAMKGFIGGMDIEDLPIPFTAVATDVDSRQEVWFQQGPLDAAIRASMAMPSMFTPVVINGRLMVDGGLVNPVPIDPTIPIPADLTIAVSLNGNSEGRARSEARTAEESPEEARRWHIPGLTTAKAQPESVRTWQDAPKGLGYIDLISRSLDVSTELVRRYRMAGHPPDVLVDIPFDACKVMDFHRAQEMIDLGRALAIEAFDAAGL